jgi:hypothetical protein
MREDQIVHNMRLTAQDLGFLFYHTYDSRRSDKGFPDTVVCGPVGSSAPSTLYYEVKTRKRRVEYEQLLWLQTLRAAGYVARLIYEDETQMPGKHPDFEATLGDYNQDIADAYQRHLRQEHNDETHGHCHN